MQSTRATASTATGMRVCCYPDPSIRIAILPLLRVRLEPGLPRLLVGHFVLVADHGGPTLDRPDVGIAGSGSRGVPVVLVGEAHAETRLRIANVIVADAAPDRPAALVDIDDDPGIMVALDRIEVLPRIACAGLALRAISLREGGRRGRRQTEQNEQPEECVHRCRLTRTRRSAIR